jgi:cobalt-zinc-cadmium efflux system protein
MTELRTIKGEGSIRPGTSRRLMIALGLSLTVLGIEIGGGLFAGSLALLSDAAHVLVDVVALCVGVGAAHMAAREPDEHHTYGFHRLEAMGALANAVLLIAASAVVFVESVGRLFNPSPVDARVVLAVAVVGLIVNGTSALIVHGSERHTGATRVLVLHLGGDALGSIAVIASALVVLVGGSPVADPVASLVIAVLLAILGLRLLGQIVHLLSEGVPADVPLGTATTALRAVPGVRAVHDLHVWSIAEDLPVVTAHLETSPDADAGAVLIAAGEALRRIGVGHATIQLEGDPCGQGMAATGGRPGEQ